MRLKTDSAHFAVGSHEFLPPGKMGRKAFNFQGREEIVFIGKVADRPKETTGNGFWLRLDADFGFPFLSRRVANIELGAVAIGVFLNKCHWQLGLVFLTAGAVEEVFRFDVARVGPQDQVLVDSLLMLDRR